jgi:hypothetical protein
MPSSRTQKLLACREWVDRARRSRWAWFAITPFYYVLAFAPLDPDPARCGSNPAFRNLRAQQQVSYFILLIYKDLFHKNPMIARFGSRRALVGTHVVA